MFHNPDETLKKLKSIKFDLIKCRNLINDDEKLENINEYIRNLDMYASRLTTHSIPLNHELPKSSKNNEIHLSTEKVSQLSENNYNDWKIFAEQNIDNISATTDASNQMSDPIQALTVAKQVKLDRDIAAIEVYTMELVPTVRKCVKNTSMSRLQVLDYISEEVVGNDNIPTQYKNKVISKVFECVNF